MHQSGSYIARRPATSRFVPVRGLQYHVNVWGEATSTAQPPLVLLHGWMDVGASFQFVVDALVQQRQVLAPDWRGFGLTACSADTFWFADYLADLDTLLDVLAPGQAVDLVGHSMGGNAVMLYAGLRPRRVRRLVNLEGFGLPATEPAQARARYTQWLDGLKAPAALRPYASLAEVAQRLMKTNPRLPADKAAWLAPHWAGQAADGRWHLNGAAAHKQAGPLLYRHDEVLAIWRCIEAPLLWVEGDLTDLAQWYGSRYTRGEFESRLAQVPSAVQRERLAPSGHMLHHDQPEALAAHLERFLAG
jgi:pimeloyl-ACP methyl ester carboxylesterase